MLGRAPNEAEGACVRLIRHLLESGVELRPASRDPGPVGPSQRAVSTVVEKEKPDDEKRDRDSEEPEKSVFHDSFPLR